MYNVNTWNKLKPFLMCAQKLTGSQPVARSKQTNAWHDNTCYKTRNCRPRATEETTSS